MDLFTVTPIYAALIALLLIVLTVRVGLVRRAKRISLGDGGDIILSRRIRTHANLIEYAPLALILMALAEGAGAAPIMLHALGILLVVARIAHAVGLSAEPDIVPLRAAGAVLTLLALIAGAALCVHAVAV